MARLDCFERQWECIAFTRNFVAHLPHCAKSMLEISSIESLYKSNSYLAFSTFSTRIQLGYGYRARRN